jgi:starch-binding outer membrane protein, SusD/RagB family
MQLKKEFMKHIHILLAGLLILCAASCKKFVETPQPRNELAASLVFTDDKTATAAMVGLYSNMNSFNYFWANVLMNYLTAMQADDLYYFTGFENYDVFLKNTLLPSSQYVQSMWNDQYSYIYHANSCIEGLTKATALSEPVKNQLLGEAYFMRAFLHFYLVNMYGDVPLITSTDYVANGVKPRDKSAVVYDQIIKDLNEAKNLMADNYPTGTRVRPNKAAATAMLARVYLYTKQWSLAEAEATQVLTNTRYELLKDLNTVFLANSREAIWQLMPVNTANGRNTWEGFTSTPATPTGTPLFRLDTINLIQKFEATDKRLANWTGFRKLSSGATVYFPYKYKVRTNTSGALTEYSMVLRLAEQFLIRAEARIQQDKLDDGRADLDSVRTRAGLLPLPVNLDKNALLLAVEQERKVELFVEWGHRWFDLKRTARADQVLKPIKGASWQATDTLYPIPLDARKTNIHLDQNEGYK